MVAPNKSSREGGGRRRKEKEEEEEEGRKYLQIENSITFSSFKIITVQGTI